MKKYTTIIFDLDGTLLNTLEDLTDAVNVMLRNFEYPERTLEEVRRFVGNGIRRLVERALPENVNHSIYEEAFSFFASYYTQNCRIKTRPYDGVLELIESLADKGVRMAIVSNKNDAAVKELNQYYFAEHIHHALGVTDKLAKKPAPEMIWEAFKELAGEDSVSREEALYVGDSEVDKQTADNAGLDCALVSWGFRERALLENLAPAYLIDAPCELLDLLSCT